MLFFGGHHSFLDTGEKEDAIQRLRAIAARPDAPTSPQIEDYLRASGATDARGIIRAAKWYGEILEGRRHLDRVLASYSSHYNAERPHRGIDLRAPEKRTHVEPVEIVPKIKRRELLGGLIHEYYPVAA